MKPEQIRQMRALLAARSEPAPTKPQGLVGAVHSVLQLRSEQPPRLAKPSPSGQPWPTLAAFDDASPSAAPAAASALPLDAAIAAFGPRVSAFGRRSRPPRRPGRDGPAIGDLGRELEADADAADKSAHTDDRSLAASATVTPFFDDDLADDPGPAPLSRFGRSTPSEARAQEPVAPEPPPQASTDMKRLFLLADLAAKLAGHGAELGRRQEAIRSDPAARDALLAKLAATLSIEDVRVTGDLERARVGTPTTTPAGEAT